METTYVITGGAGNLASQLTFELDVPPPQIVLLDVVDSPKLPVVAGCRYERADATDYGALRRVLRAHRPAVVLHMASLLSAQSEQDRDLAWRVNVQSTINVCEAMVELGIGRLFFASSVASYGGAVPDPMPEDFPQWPIGFYGVTKVVCERLGTYYGAKHGLDFRALRLPLVMSRHAHPGAASSYASLAFVEARRRGRFVFTVNPTTRVSSLYAKDAARAIRMLATADQSSLTRRVYNIHGIAPTAAQIAAAIRARVPDAKLTFEPDPQVVALAESWPAVIDDTCARRDWGWEPRFDLESLADDFVNDLRS